MLWLFVYAVIRTIRADIATAGGSRIIRRDRRARGDHAKGSARYLVDTWCPRQHPKITLGAQPVLMGRAANSTLVLTDDYASERHARLSRRGDDWYVEGSRLHQRHLPRPREGHHRGPRPHQHTDPHR